MKLVAYAVVLGMGFACSAGALPAQEMLPPAVAGPGAPVMNSPPPVVLPARPLVTRIYQLGPTAAQAAAQSATVLGAQNRQSAFSRQIAVQDQVRWLAGLPSVFGDLPAYDLDFAYSGLGVPGAASSGWPYGRVFEPWPLVRGDIYGGQYYRQTPQPVGHQITPTSHNGYTYAPVYAPAPVAALVAPPVVPGPPVVIPPTVVTPAPSGSLREF